MGETRGYVGTKVKSELNVTHQRETTCDAFINLDQTQSNTGSEFFTNSLLHFANRTDMVPCYKESEVLSLNSNICPLVSSLSTVLQLIKG